MVTVMLKRLMMITGLMLLTSASWAQGLDKASSFAVEQDALTGVWTLECSAEVSDIDRLGAYTVDVHVQYTNGSTSTTIFNTRAVILPNQRSASEFADGMYTFEAKKVGKKLTASVEATWNAANSNDVFYCSIGLYSGEIPEVDTLHNVVMSNRAAF